MSNCNNPNCSGSNIYVSGSETKKAIEASNNRSRYYAELAEKYKNEAKELRDSAQYYAEQNSDVTKAYVDEIDVTLRNLIATKQNSGDYALNSAIPTKVSDLTNDSGFITATPATVSNLGVVKPDGSTITVDSNGKISAMQRNLGEVVVSTIPLTDAGLHLLDGALISGSGSYSAFVSYMAELYNSGNYSARFTTEANWQASVASNGLCSQFVYDSVNNTVRLPKWGNIAYTKQYTLTLASTVPVRGNGIALGITNGTDLLGLSNSSPNSLSVYTGLYGKGVGATWSGTNPTVANLGTGITTDGTKSGLVANTSGVAGLTNDPLNCYYYIVIATTTKPDIQVDIDEIATDLNGKADVDLTNLTNTGNIKMAHSAMPSDLYENITVGASAASYQAPADGYFAARGVSTAANGFALLCLDTGAYFGNFSGMVYSSGLGCNAVLPVRKGDYVYLMYGNVNFSAFRFYYAVGSESEAV